jgi:hypothetical protein
MKIKSVCNASAQEAIWGTEENGENNNNRILWREELDRKDRTCPDDGFYKGREKHLYFVKLDIS